MPRIGPYSSCATLRKLDGRTREARLVKALRAELAAHVGGRPTIPQQLLIDQAAELRLRLASMEASGADAAEMTERNQVQYLAWHGCLVRLLAQLGVKAAPARTPSISDIMRSSPPHHGAAA